MRNTRFGLRLAAVAAALCLALTGCGGAGGTAADGEEQVLNLTLSHGLAEDHAVHIAMSAFADEVREESGGTINIEIFPNGVLGSETDNITQIRAGALDMAKVSASTLGNFQNEWNVLSVPYVFNDQQHYYDVMDGDIAQDLYQLTADKGFQGLTWLDSGARSFYTADRAIRTPADLHGLRIRTMDSQMAIDMMDALGGSATVMGYSDIYTGMQQGVIDGAENNVTAMRDHADVTQYRMTPYLYSAEYEASRTGAPIMRPLVFEFQNDPNVYDESFEFLYGRDILVANVIEPGAKTRKVYLPAGCKWYDWNNNFACYEGGQTIEVPVDMTTIPMFVREGAIIPMADNQLMSMANDHTTDLHLVLAPGKDSAYTLYDDDGVTNDFKKGVCRKTDITMTGTDVVKVAFAAAGSYTDFVERVTVEMIRKDRSPFWVALGEEKLEHFLNRRKFEAAEKGWYYSQTKKAVLVKYPNPRKDIVLTVSFEDFDLIGM